MEAVRAAQGAPDRREGQLSPPDRPTQVVVCAGHALCHGTKVALPVVTVSVAAAEFGVGPSDVGLAIAAFTAGMAASSVPAGLLGDRFGTSRVLALYFWLTALASVACALAPSFPWFLLAHALLGVAAGVFHPAGLGLLSLTVEPARLGHAMGVFGVFGSVGVALTPLCVHGDLGWRFGFLVFAALGVAGAVACHVLRGAGRMLAGVPSPEVAARVSGVRTAGLGFLLLVMGVNAFVLDGFMPLFPETIVAGGALLLDEQTAMTCVLALGGLGQYLGGLVARDAFAVSRYAIIVLAQPLVLLGLAHTLAEPAWPYMLMAVFAGLNYMTQPIENRLMAAYTSARRRSTAYALKFVATLAISTPAPILITRLYDEGGWTFGPLYRLLSLTGMAGVFAAWLFLRARRVQRAG